MKMPRPGNEVFEQKTIHLDDGHFVKTSFVECRLVYSGTGLPPVLIEVDFIDSTFILDGAAHRTAAYLSSLASSGAHAKDLVLGMLGIVPNG